MRLEGFGIFVTDMDAMVEFYRHVLEFEIKYSSGDGNVYLIKDGVLFLMFGRNDFEEMVDKKFIYPKGMNGTFEIALQAKNYSDVDVCFAKVVAKGAKPILEPSTMPWGQRTCYIADPEGNMIEIGSFIDDTKEKCES